MTQENEKEIASRVSYEIVKDMAPKELIFFDDYKERFLKNPDAFWEKDRKKRDKMLGFAIPDGTTQLLTTFVLPIALETIKNYWSKRKTSQKLSSNQLETMRSEAYNNAITLGVEKEKAELMADALVGKIVRLSEAK